jgi:N-acetylglucosamine kinase-like BadF-type ATPase
MIAIGLDAGGSKTTAVIGDDTSEVKRITGTMGAMRPGLGVAVAAAIADMVRGPLVALRVRQADALVVGAAGAGRLEEQIELRDALWGERIAKKVRVTTDAEIALEALGRPIGIILISGTGSVVLGRNAAGAVTRRGGYGWQMSDEGSGYAVGRAALRAVGQAYDGRGPATALLDLIVAKIPGSGVDAVIRWSTIARPFDIAALVPLVAQAARDGDKVATAILDEAGSDLAALVRSLLPSFGANETIPVGYLGGLLTEDGPLADRVTEALRSEPRLEILPGTVDPASGALAMSRRLAAEE